MTNLKGKTALVTGASRGIGRATAIALAKAGARVLVHYGNDERAADSVVAAIRAAGGQADKVAADLRDAHGPHELAKRVRSLAGERLDILVANAGISKAASIEETTVEDFDNLVAVNVRAPFFLVQQLLPVLGDGSSVVLLSSLSGARVREQSVGLRGDQGRHRYACAPLCIRTRRARHSGQRDRAGRRRNGHVELCEDGRWP